MDDLQKTYLDKYKKLALLDVGFDYSDLSTYEKYLTGDDEQQIKRQAEELAADISAHNTATDVYIDDRTWKPF